MRYVGTVVYLALVLSTSAPRRVVASPVDFAKDAIARIFAHTRLGHRAPLLLLTANPPASCAPIVEALAAEAKELTHVHLRDTAHVRSAQGATDIFNVSPGPGMTAAPTPFEEYLDKFRYGGIVMFSNDVGESNAITAERVARIYSVGQHVSAAGRFPTARQAFILQTALSVAVAKDRTLAALLPTPVWTGMISDCYYKLVDGDAFGAAVAAAEPTAVVPAAQLGPGISDFAGDLITRMGRSHIPTLLPPLVVLTGLKGASCGTVASQIFQMANAVMPAQSIFPTSASAFADLAVAKFFETNLQGLVVVRKSVDTWQTQLGTSHVGKFILDQEHSIGNRTFDMTRYKLVLETTPEAQLMPGMSISSILNRAQASDEAHGCRWSLFSGIGIRALMRYHASCQTTLETP